jgi:DNA-binding NarL/FixJ family response regulator
MAKVKEYDSDGVEVIRDLTPQEIASNLKDHQVIENEMAKIEAKATARASALAKLAALGLSADEIAAL